MFVGLSYIFRIAVFNSFQIAGTMKIPYRFIRGRVDSQASQTTQCLRGAVDGESQTALQVRRQVATINLVPMLLYSFYDLYFKGMLAIPGPRHFDYDYCIKKMKFS